MNIAATLPVVVEPPVRALAGEARFDIDELFFSRTDGRGVILSFNSVFCRIAAYPPARLLGAPHRIIRHEDMPKGVFWLMWQALKAGHCVGAYVKNQASNGSFYWVYAMVSPVEDGYLSVRLKPTGPLFEAVRREYDRLLAEERAEKLTPEESGRRLLARLAELGFPSYAAFQARCLSDEVAARADALGRDEDRPMRLIGEIVDASNRIAEGRRGIAREISAMRLVPLNMRIMSARIERSGGPLSAISDNYRSLAADLAEKLSGFLSEAVTEDPFVFRPEERALFLRAGEILMHEAEAAFRAEPEPPEGVDVEDEEARLAALSEQYLEQSRAAIIEVNQRAARLMAEVQGLRRAILGLDSVRILCRVEDGRLGARAHGLRSMIGMLDAFHHLMDERLDVVLGLSQLLLSHAGAVLSATDQAA